MPDRFAAVCVVDPAQPGAEDRLAYWIEERGCRGLRLRPRMPREEAAFGDPSTFALWRTASRTQAVVSVLASPEHLTTLAELLERFPGVDVIVDHLGHPDLLGGRSKPGMLALLKLAPFPRLFIKLSGFYHFTKEPYPYRDCIEIVRTLYDRFGPQRLIWGSDFPHVLLTMSYPRGLHWLKRECSFIPAAELESILGHNALGLYWRSAANS
jgi:predicted TIM-barrel fold metal-dependent hydrolase